MMAKTPILMNPSSTPILGGALGGLSSMSPYYIGNSSYHGGSTIRPGMKQSDIRSPSYIYQGSASNSPNYSSLRSHSPDYNSPMNSSGRYGNSPNYSPSPMEQNRNYFKNEEDVSDEDDE